MVWSGTGNKIGLISFHLAGLRSEPINIEFVIFLMLLFSCECAVSKEIFNLS